MSAQQAGPIGEGPPLDTLSVLVVDDLDDAAMSMAEVLSLCGVAHVSIANTGSAALELSAADPPDVVLLDIGLPDLNGWEVARWMREQAKGKCKRPFLIAITGFGSEADRRQSAAAGVDLHLVKPADPEVLIGVLRRFARIITPGRLTTVCEA
jgi:two-component system OmpR family response regulator